MPKAIVDGVEVEFEHGMSVLQVAELAGAEIPPILLPRPPVRCR